jgi:hypothetical protein
MHAGFVQPRVTRRLPQRHVTSTAVGLDGYMEYAPALFIHALGFGGIVASPSLGGFAGSSLRGVLTTDGAGVGVVDAVDLSVAQPCKVRANRAMAVGI